MDSAATNGTKFIAFTFSFSSIQSFRMKVVLESRLPCCMRTRHVRLCVGRLRGNQKLNAKQRMSSRAGQSFDRKNGNRFKNEGINCDAYGPLFSLFVWKCVGIWITYGRRADCYPKQEINCDLRATTHTILRKERTTVLMQGKQQHKQTTHICFFLFHQRTLSG